MLSRETTTAPDLLERVRQRRRAIVRTLAAVLAVFGVVSTGAACVFDKGSYDGGGRRDTLPAASTGSAEEPPPEEEPEEEEPVIEEDSGFVPVDDGGSEAG